LVQDVTDSIEIAIMDSNTFYSKKWILPDLFDMKFNGKIHQNYSNKTVLMRFNISNPLDHKIYKILYFDQMLTGNVNLYDGENLQKSGSSVFVSKRELQSVFTAFHIELNTKESKTYFIRLKSHEILNTKILLTSKQNFKLIETEKFNTFRFYTGAVLALFLYNLFLAIFIKDKNYYFYSGFILSLFVTLVGLDGMMDMIEVFPTKTVSHYLISFSSVSLIFCLLFTLRLIPLTKKFLYFNKIFRLQLILALVPIFICIIPVLNQFIWLFGYYIDILVFIGLASMIIYGLLNAMENNSLAIIYSVSWTSFFIGVFIFLLSLYDIIDRSWFTSNSILIGNILQMLILSLGIGYKFIAIEREKDEAVSRAKNKEKFQKLLRVLSHDVSNSLQVIQLSLKRLGKGVNDKKNVEKIDRILSVSENMRSILDNVKKEQKLELDKEQLVLEKIDLLHCLNKILIIFEDRIEDKKIDLKLNISNEYTKVLSEEVSLINSVLGNIISNVIKFSPVGGQVKIDIFKKDNYVQMSIADEGCGFSNNLLNSFENEENIISTLGTEGEDGTGFGMKIIKSYMELFKGKIFLSNSNGAVYKLFFKAV
jgi:signal transduction histidine kinase